MTTNGTITAVGNISTSGTNTSSGHISTTNGTISGKAMSGTIGSCTGIGKAIAPSVVGVYLFEMDTTAACGIEICSTSMQYIDFTVLNSDSKGRVVYNSTDSSFALFIDASATAKMTLNATAFVLVAQRSHHVVRD